MSGIVFLPSLVMGRKVLAVAFLFCALRVFGANGDTVSVTINTDGVTAYWAISGYLSNTASAFSSGLDSQRNPGPLVPGLNTAKFVLTVPSPGFDTAGNIVTNTRTVYGTFIRRQPYPNQAFKDEIVGGGNVTNCICLSDPIWIGDTNPITCTILANCYSNNSAATITAVNNSTLAYPSVVGAHWQVVPFQLVTNTMTLKATAFHMSAGNGRPVQCIAFRWTDGTHSGTNIVKDWTVDRSMPDAVPYAQAVTTFDISGATQGALITCNFTAYPRWGTNAFDTTQYGFAWPTAYPAPLTNICDNAGTFGGVWARVDTVNGNDSTGVALTNSAWAGNNFPNPFLTIAAALKACSGSNTVYGRGATIDNAHIILGPGLYAWMGATVSGVTISNITWAHILPSNGVAASSIIFTNLAGTAKLVTDKDKYHFTGISTSGSAAGGLFQQEHVWLDQCGPIVWTGADFCQQGSLVNAYYFTQCTIPNMKQGLRPVNGQLMLIPLCRGNTLTSFQNTIQPYNFCGNLKVADNLGTLCGILSGLSAQTWPTNYFGLMYNNILYGISSASDGVIAPGTLQVTNGFAVIQNIIESSTNAPSAGSFDMGIQDTEQYTNVLNWCNLWANSRITFCYNASGSAAAWRVNWSSYNNLYSDYNLKTDAYVTTPDAARVGNWAMLFGASRYADINLSFTNVTAYQSFDNEDPAGDLGFEGLNCYPYYWDNGSTGAWTNYARWITPPSYPTVGNANVTSAYQGDYHLHSYSPLTLRPRAKWVLPFDIFGNPRGADDPSGPVCVGNPRKGVFVGL